MANIREIITDWTSPNSPGGQTVMYFLESGETELVSRTALNSLWAGMASLLDNGTSWTVRTQGDVLDDATGALVGGWENAAPLTGSGSLAGNAVPNAAQVLLRWDTGAIVSGRRLRGRTFVPGASANINIEGQIQAAAVTDAQGAITDFLTGTAAFLIWHRPIQNAGGQSVLVASGTCWNEFAVQRGRR